MRAAGGESGEEEVCLGEDMRRRNAEDGENLLEQRSGGLEICCGDP